MKHVQQIGRALRPRRFRKYRWQFWRRKRPIILDIETRHPNCRCVIMAVSTGAVDFLGPDNGDRRYYPLEH